MNLNMDLGILCDIYLEVKQAPMDAICLLLVLTWPLLPATASLLPISPIHHLYLSVLLVVILAIENSARNPFNTW